MKVSEGDTSSPSKNIPPKNTFNINACANNKDSANICRRTSVYANTIFRYVRLPNLRIWPVTTACGSVTLTPSTSTPFCSRVRLMSALLTPSSADFRASKILVFGCSFNSGISDGAAFGWITVL